MAYKSKNGIRRAILLICYVCWQYDLFSKSNYSFFYQICLFKWNLVMLNKYRFFFLFLNQITYLISILFFTFTLIYCSLLFVKKIFIISQNMTNSKISWLIFQIFIFRDIVVNMNNVFFFFGNWKPKIGCK